jgi:hypothetical protein
MNANACSDNQIQTLYYGPRHRMAFRIGTYLALIRMMGIGHLVTALYGRSHLVDQTRLRLSRTRQTLRALICEGFESAAGRSAVQRLRDAHRGLTDTTGDDYRYVLATFFLEPLRWNEAFGRQALNAAELGTLLAFWHRVGEAMGIGDLPAHLDDWRRLQQAYEARHLRATPEGHRLAQLCLRDVVKLTVPAGTRWAFRGLMRSTMEPHVRDILGIAPARGAPRWVVRLGLAVMASASARMQAPAAS